MLRIQQRFGPPARACYYVPDEAAKACSEPRTINRLGRSRFVVSAKRTREDHRMPSDGPRCEVSPAGSPGGRLVMNKTRIRGSLPGVVLVVCSAGALAQSAAPPIAEAPPLTPASPPPANAAPQSDTSFASPPPAPTANVPSTPAPGAPSAPSAPQAPDNVRPTASPVRPDAATSP